MAIIDGIDLLAACSTLIVSISAVSFGCLMSDKMGIRMTLLLCHPELVSGTNALINCESSPQ